MKRQRIKLDHLQVLEEEFRTLLVECLGQCGRGRWGLFGAHDRLDIEGLRWREADRVHELAIEIQAILAESGQQDRLCAEFLEIRKNEYKRRHNGPGEPILAREFLKRLEDDKSEGR